MDKFSLTGFVAATLLVLLAACANVVQTTTLEDLQNQRIVRGNAAVEACIVSKCNELDLDHFLLEDYSILNELPHVTALMLSGTSFANLEDISGMSQLIELHISRTEVADLSGLKNFPNLRLLHARKLPEITNFSPIAQLVNLTELDLDNLREGNDLSFIKKLTKLENLVLRWDSGNAQINMLRGHPALRNVEIHGDLPEDQSALLEIPHLQAILITYYGTLDADIQAELERREVWKYIPAVIVC